MFIKSNRASPRGAIVTVGNKRNLKELSFLHVIIFLFSLNIQTNERLPTFQAKKNEFC